MKYLLERFPVMSCPDESFPVALKRLRVEQFTRSFDLLERTSCLRYEAEATIQAHMHPKSYNFKLHPLFEFVRRHPVSIPRHLFLDLPEPVEFRLCRAPSILYQKDRAIFELTGRLCPDPLFLDIAPPEDKFHLLHSKPGVWEYVVTDAHVPENM